VQVWGSASRSAGGSHSRTAGNFAPGAAVANYPKNTHTIKLYSETPYGAWTLGGHYIEMDADTDGVFHPLWADSRSGTYQLYTAAVFVTTPRVTAYKESAATDGTQYLSASHDPLQFLPGKSAYIIPVRLKNTSRRTIYGPLVVRIHSTTMPSTGRFKADYPVVRERILNADNRKLGEGATFDYSSALGSLGYLPPNAVTNAIPWHVWISDPADPYRFDLEFTVTGIAK